MTALSPILHWPLDNSTEGETAEKTQLEEEDAEMPYFAAAFHPSQLRKRASDILGHSSSRELAIH